MTPTIADPAPTPPIARRNLRSKGRFLLPLLAGFLSTVGRAASVHAEPDGPKLDIGVRVAALRAVSVGGMIGPTGTPGDATTAYGVKLYGDWPVLAHLRIGVAIPSTLNGPGPTSNEYDVGLALRIVLETRIAPSVRGYLSLEPALIAAKLPGGEWWNGQQATVALGAQIETDAGVALLAEMIVQPTAISGDVNYPAQFDALMNGDVRTLYVGAGVGAVARF